ncbi:GntR family transcriptional regulator [Phenylobacterium sp. VNQ135]|uniref:GntR family transcriptional regulator n=1 Tax=Phenylobacterium sp. VNQ135 TaxID=3400922 RepID=UPI003C0D39E8
MSTQTEAAIAQLRELLMKGEFAAGQKLGEKLLADRLNVSRTPIRLALSELAKEGLLEYHANRGFVVRRFSIDTIVDAVAVREQLEGMAAGLAAKRGLGESHQRTLEGCLLQIDGLLLKTRIDHRDVQTWSEINGAFHNAIVEAADNQVLADFVRRLEMIPLASARTFAGISDHLGAQLAVIRTAQAQHRWVYEAILAGDAHRAETVMRQHIYDGRNNLRRLLERLKTESDDNLSILRLVS